MAEKPVFIISFDCEGKWGLADCLSDFERDQLTNENLDSAYQRLVDILDRRNLKGTFAFTGAFTMSYDEYVECKDWFRDYHVNGQGWLTLFRNDIENREFEGWLNPEPLKIVKRNGIHEIASHGFTHLPLHENLISTEAFLHEMDCISRWEEMRGLSCKTFVFPRNKIGFRALLRNAGFIGYRDGDAELNQRWNQVRILHDEINMWKNAQPHSTGEDTLLAIPSGFFLNWRVNLRKYIPMGVTLARWHHAIENAIKNDAVIHLFTHPQDYLTGDRQYQLLEEILDFVQQKRESGEITNQTQIEYCNYVLGR